MINVTYSQKNCTLLMTSGIFWNLEIGNREIWKIPEIGWFGPILTFWVYFPLSLGHWAWLWSQNSKIPIFLEFCQKFSGNLEIPRNGLIWINFDVLGIISTQFLSLSSILNSEFRILIKKTKSRHYSKLQFVWRLFIFFSHLLRVSPYFGIFKITVVSRC